MGQKRNQQHTTTQHGGVLAAMRRKPRKPPRPLLSLTVIVLLLFGWMFIRYEPVIAPEDADVIVYVSLSCKCYKPWIRQLRRDGLAVSVLKTRDIVLKQSSLGVPREFSSCHTAVASGFWLEGHVPAASITALTSEAPGKVAGIAHLRANVNTGEGLTYEVVSYDTLGQALARTQQGQSIDENENGVTHD